MSVAEIINSEPIISVGILEKPKIDFELHGEYAEDTHPDKSTWYIPITSQSFFTLKDVKFGIGFHWQQEGKQSFRGPLQLLRRGKNTIAINHIFLEEYLQSVIASEMSATANEEFLRAHAIVSRSWLLAMLQRRNKKAKHTKSAVQSDNEIVRWYDREDHKLFDVCADDHCQRYQGIGRITNSKAIEAVRATRGEVLTYEGKICDARFSKCCGGKTELYENCWGPETHPYLEAVADRDAEGGCFCDTTDEKILSQVLNDFDQKTTDFFRWHQEYDRGELSQIVSEKTGRDLGQISEIIPIERGVSGRITRLKIIGEKDFIIIGKELEIRRVLSPTHLKSSWFEVEKRADGGFIFNGRGWGHGVGLCQIGAAVMGAKGYSSEEILRHYFPHAQLTKIYR